MSTLPIALAEALGLESMNQPTLPTFQELLERLYRVKYQGSVTLHFAGGLPRSVVLNQPVQVPLGSKSPLTGGGK